MAWIAALCAWLLWSALVLWLERNPRGDFVTGLVYRGCQLYGRFAQRTTVVGAEHIPTSMNPGRLIVAPNHTAGVDPIVIQYAIPFEPRWMMGADMMHPVLDPFWNWARTIAVNRFGRDMNSAKEAIRHLNEEGVLGIFPEAGIEKPYGELMPFMPGVGLIIARTKAPVLPVFISGTPRSESAYGSFFRRGHAKLVFGPLMTFDGMSAAESTTKLRAWFEAQSAIAASQSHRAADDESLGRAQG